jgi:hypothetical protein
MSSVSLKMAADGGEASLGMDGNQQVEWPSMVGSFEIRLSSPTLGRSFLA